jgi:hypothetical protein
LVGGLLAGLMGLGILIRVAAANPHPCSIVGIVIEGLIGLMGLFALVYGARILIFGQRVVTPPDRPQNGTPEPPPSETT